MLRNWKGKGAMMKVTGRRMGEKLPVLLRRAAERLGTTTTGYSKARWMLMLALFCSAGTAISITVLVSALSGNTKDSLRISQPIRIPVLPDHEAVPQTRILERDMQAVRRFDTFFLALSSLERDSLQRARPGLLDSALTLKRLFEAQRRRDSAAVFFNP